jgi:hypothetical protein
VVRPPAFVLHAKVVIGVLDTGEEAAAAIQVPPPRLVMVSASAAEYPVLDEQEFADLRGAAAVEAEDLRQLLGAELGLAVGFDVELGALDDGLDDVVHERPGGRDEAEPAQA